MRKGIPNIDKKSINLPMRHFQNRNMFLSTIIQNKVEFRLLRKRFRTIEDMIISIKLLKEISRVIDLRS